MSTAPLLEVVDIHKRFTGVYALRGVSLSFQRGQIYHLLGENGCGKSTLIKIISGVHQPERGATMIFDGRSIEPTMETHPPGKAGIGERCFQGAPFSAVSDDI